MEHLNCQGCTDDHTREPGPIQFIVRPVKAGHADNSFTCERHLAMVVRAYGRQGFACHVRTIRLTP